MWQQQIAFTLTLYACLAAQARGGSESRFNGATSGAQANNEAIQVNLNAWQPLRGHNNWLILQATAATNVQQQQQQQQEPQQERLPVNYYAYNHRYQQPAESAADGNYKQVPAGLTDSPSYVWAIRQSSQDVAAEMRQVDNYAALAKAADEPAKPTVQHINSYLAAFEKVVLGVGNFCDTVRGLISGEEEPQELLPSASVPGKLLGSTLATTSKEVQGRHSRLAGSYNEGRKLKKLKKKIQKLLLPLLIAYKLKFLTLIPVLIGGLTLLVGTTGLAGFFFALFTAVMSLKSSTGGGHSSKAIVLKKI